MEWKVTDLSIFWIGKTIKGTWFEPRLSHAQCRSRDNILENCFVQAQSTRIRIFLNPQLFFSDMASVHTYPVNLAYESATFLIPSREWKFLNMPWNPKSCGRLMRIFLSGDVTISSPVLYREYCVQDGDHDAWSVANFPIGALGTRVNPDSGGRTNSIWIPIRVDVEIFETGKKKSCGLKNIRIRVLYVRIIRLNLKGQISLRPTLGKQNLQAKEVHVL